MKSIDIRDVFDAYYECRKNKRNKAGALQFEVDLERNLVELWEDINNGTYYPRASSVFIVEKPVIREIFAASFRDRIVHHIVINKLMHLFEKSFILDSYSCRKKKGTHFGIARAERFLKRNENGWVLKIDIRGYFMSINKIMLFEKIERFIEEKYQMPDKEILKELCKRIIFNDPTKDCIYKCKKDKWKNLPNDKSLFTAKPNCGLPIGNLTSQVFANYYLNEFDHYIKHTCGIKNYGRYVDDCIIASNDKEELKRMVWFIKHFLMSKLKLKLHPDKIYLQPCKKGVKFLGSFIKPSHTVINHRTIQNFKNSLFIHNKIVEDHKPNKEEVTKFMCSVNSYLGIMKHYKTFRKRYMILTNSLSLFWLKHVKINTYDFGKVNISQPPAPPQEDKYYEYAIQYMYPEF